MTASNSNQIGQLCHRQQENDGDTKLSVQKIIFPMQVSIL